MGEPYEYEKKLEGEGFACGNWETKFVAEIGFLVFLLILGFCLNVWNNPFFLLSFDIQILFPGAFSLDLAAIEGRVGADRLSEVNFVMFNNLEVIPDLYLF